MLWDLLVRSCYVNLADGKVHATTIANTLSQACQLNRNADIDRFLIVYLVEVNVQRCVCNWVELNFFQNCSVMLSINVQIDNIDVWSVDDFTKFTERNCKCMCLWPAVSIFLLTIEVTWNTLN